MRRLNVQETQIGECIQKSLFALPGKPQNPELKKGELLLLQLVKEDARNLRKLDSRINFALIFDRLEADHDGTLSRLHWPAAGKVWKWILHCLATVPTIPFSLENLNLSRSYEGQGTAQYIDPVDEPNILRLIQWSLAATPERQRQIVSPSEVAKEFGPIRTLGAIYNHDQIAILQPPPKKVVTIEQIARNPWLAESLKSFYDYHCQLCDFDFVPDLASPLPILIT